MAEPVDIAALEAEGRAPVLHHAARRAGLAPSGADVLLSRLPGELGLVQELPEAAGAEPGRRFTPSSRRRPGLRRPDGRRRRGGG